jgi:hypothetical protein
MQDKEPGRSVFCVHVLAISGARETEEMFLIPAVASDKQASYVGLV